MNPIPGDLSSLMPAARLPEQRPVRLFGQRKRDLLDCAGEPEWRLVIVRHRGD
jgi:hypothetical protein